MRLTEEERRIAEGVAAGWVRGGASWDAAWGLAMKYIATRREAFGESEPPGTAMAAGVGGGDWLPIESAPRDGTLVLLWDDDDRVGYAARWVSEPGMNCPDGHEPAWAGWESHHDPCEEADPRLWMMHPKAPVGLPPDPEPADGVDCPAAAGCPAPDNAAGQDTRETAAPRGVVVTVTEGQRRAVEFACNFIKATTVRSAGVAVKLGDLPSLLAAIDAAKGGE